MRWHSDLCHHRLIEEHHPEPSVHDLLQLLRHELGLPVDPALEILVDELGDLDLLPLDLELGVQLPQCLSANLLRWKPLNELLCS